MFFFLIIISALKQQQRRHQTKLQPTAIHRLQMIFPYFVYNLADVTQLKLLILAMRSHSMEVHVSLPSMEDVYSSIKEVFSRLIMTQELNLHVWIGLGQLAPLASFNQAVTITFKWLEWDWIVKSNPWHFSQHCLTHCATACRIPRKYFQTNKINLHTSLFTICLATVVATAPINRHLNTKD